MALTPVAALAVHEFRYRLATTAGCGCGDHCPARRHSYPNPVSGAFRLGVAGMRAKPSDPSTGVLAVRYAHSLIPIALAYTASESPRAAARSQQTMLAIMVALTSLALWLSSSANQ